MPFEIIPVDPENVAEAANVHSQAWQASHRAICAPDFVAMHSPDRQTLYLREKLERGARLFLLRQDGEAAGVVSVTGGLIEDLYILPRFQNQGMGTALLRHAIGVCAGRPTLWILENNAGAERLYRREGFAPTGKRHALTAALDEVEFALFEPYQEHS